MKRLDVDVHLHVAAMVIERWMCGLRDLPICLFALQAELALW